MKKKKKRSKLRKKGKKQLKKRLNKVLKFLLTVFIIIFISNHYATIKYHTQNYTTLFNPIFSIIDRFNDSNTLTLSNNTPYGEIQPDYHNAVSNDFSSENVYYRTDAQYKIPVRFKKHIDGDTSLFETLNGAEIKARYLLIDTPETKHPTKSVEPYGIEASERTRTLLENAQKLEIEYDIGQQQDKYGRHLVYIWVDETLLQSVLVSEGLAKISYITPPNTRYLDVLEADQEKAQILKIAIWSES